MAAARPSEFVSHASEEMTLSVPGTAFSVIAVGAVDASIPIKVGPFSSYGPTRDRRNKPDVVAPGVQVEAARGGTFDDIRPESGTSMAAPHVTGAIALLLSQSREVRSAGADRVTGRRGAAADGGQCDRELHQQSGLRPHRRVGVPDRLLIQSSFPPPRGRLRETAGDLSTAPNVAM